MSRARSPARPRDAPARFREADGGTLFLDEIGDMPSAMQAKLLRVLQERVVTPGRRHGRSRSTCASSPRRTAISPSVVAAGQFREDLFYRLNVRADRAAAAARAARRHLPLAEHFLQLVGREAAPKRLTADAGRAAAAPSPGPATCAS